MSSIISEKDLDKLIEENNKEIDKLLKHKDPNVQKMAKMLKTHYDKNEIERAKENFEEVIEEGDWEEFDFYVALATQLFTEDKKSKYGLLMFRDFFDFDQIAAKCKVDKNDYIKFLPMMEYSVLSLVKAIYEVTKKHNHKLEYEVESDTEEETKKQITTPKPVQQTPKKEIHFQMVAKDQTGLKKGTVAERVAKIESMTKEKDHPRPTKR